MREDDIIKQLVEKLKPLNPERVILFGSYAYGLPPSRDSDIDGHYGRLCTTEF